MTKDELIELYQETKELCSSIPAPVSKKETYNEHTPQYGVDFETTTKEGNIIVEPMDTVSALIKYSKIGKTAVLNMASAKRKGGGVERGSMAQEECLFRCSNLFTIPDEFYPIQTYQYIYTTDVSFIRDGYYGIIDPIKADVITIPAINMNDSSYDLSKGQDRQDYECEYIDNMFAMINSALIGGCDNIILGAWGCGVFKNDPEIISDLFKEVLEGGELSKQFKNVVFAVINDRNSTGNNYQIFKDKFQ